MPHDRNAELRFDYGQLMISKIIVVSKRDVSSDAVDVSVAPSSDWGIVPSTVIDVAQSRQVGISPARTETERRQVKTTVNMNRFMELSPYVTKVM